MYYHKTFLDTVFHSFSVAFVPSQKSAELPHGTFLSQGLKYFVFLISKAMFTN